MHIKRYSIAALIFIGLVGWYVTTFISNENLNINIFGIVISSVSVSVWVMIPLFILFLASVIHMSVYSVVGSFKLRKYEKDYETIIDALVDGYLGKEERDHVFKTQRYKLLGSLIDNTQLFPKNFANLIGVSGEEEKIKNTILLIEDIRNGEVVDLKKLSLPIDNPLVVQNNRNRYVTGELSDEDILKNSRDYDAGLLSEVYANYVKTAPLNNIEKYKEFLSKDALLNIIARVNADENNLDVPNETFIELFSQLELDTQDYINISSAMAFSMIPEQRIRLFETISDTNDDAMDAYLFTLFDLQMIEQADAILDISQPNEYMNFKAYRALKDNHQNFNINLFI